jgi:O-antigen biosynthesis protein
MDNPSRASDLSPTQPVDSAQGNSSIRWHVDAVTLSRHGILNVQGWAFAANEVVIVVLLDEDEVGTATTGGHRPDVGGQYPNVANADQSGFGFHGNLKSAVEGEHLVTLVFNDVVVGEAVQIELPVQAVDAELPVPSAIGSSDDTLCKLFIDDPAISGDHAAEIVHSGLVIEGWALARDGVASIEIYLDEEWFDRANFGGRREDIAAPFPDWPGSLLSGFGVAIPPSALSNGRHVVRIELLTAAGRSTARQFTIDVEHQLAPGGPGALRQKMPATEIKISEHVLSGLQWHPHFVIFLRIEDLEKDNLAMARTLASLRDQVYRDWRIVLLLKGPKPQRPLAHLVSEDFADIADRIDFAPDIDGATLATLAVSPRTGRRPDLVAIVSSGDVLGCDAFLELAVASGLHPETEFFYGDERRINPGTGEIEAFFKPDWSPELLLATNYIGRFWCVEPDLLDRVGASLEDWQQYGDYDLLLRCAEVAHRVHHLSKVITQRADDSRDDAGQEKQALERALRQRYVAGAVKPGLAPGSFRVQRRVAGTALVSIIIPTCASRGLVKTCIETLRAVTRYRNFEIICIENIPSQERTWKTWLRQNADKVIATKEPFNWSRFNNLAARRASGEFLLFLNDDIEIVDPGWLEALLEYAEQPEVGVVGARLLYPDRKVQHAGMFWSNGRGRHAFRYSGERDAGYFGLAQTPRNVIAAGEKALLAQTLCSGDVLNSIEMLADLVVQHIVAVP